MTNTPSLQTVNCDNKDEELRSPKYNPHDHIYLWLETGQLGGVTNENNDWEDA